MNIEKRTKELLAILDGVEADIATLKKNIQEARDGLLLVKTEEDAKEFDKNHDVEEGLKYISVFISGN